MQKLFKRKGDTDMNKNYNEEQRKQALKDMLQQLQAGATLEDLFLELTGGADYAEVSRHLEG